MTVYGYARVSTACQHEDRQMISMAEMNIPESQIGAQLRGDLEPMAHPHERTQR
jgi:hypothetical protein